MAEFPRVAFIAGTLGRGGAERQLFYMARTLVQLDAQPIVACLTRGEHWERPLRRLGVPVLWFGRSSNPVRRVHHLVKLLREDGPDLLQSAHFHTNLYTVAAARLLRRPEIGAVRSDTHWALSSLGRYSRLSLTMPRHIAINSLNGFNQANGHGIPDTKITWMPNVVDIDAFELCSEPQPPAVHLLSVGRHVPVKRHDVFLELVGRLSDSLPSIDLTATIVGEGPLKQAAEAMAARLGLTDIVRFQTNADMSTVYRDASIFVLTSDAEGTPNVVLEAMAAGVPVVAFGVGAVPELIQDDVGVCVEPGNTGELYERVAELCLDPRLRRQLGTTGRGRVQERFAPDAMEKWLRLLYRRMAAQQAVRPAGAVARR